MTAPRPLPPLRVWKALTTLLVSLSLPLALLAQTPSITSFNPTSGAIGSKVVIRGNNFRNLQTVRFNTANATTFSVNGNAATKITVTVPAGATTGKITVTTATGTVVSAGTFTITTNTPIINAFTPSAGPVGTVVTITGANFTGSTVVRFNGTSASFSVVNATTISATVPAGASTGPISVQNASGTGTSVTNFTVSSTAPSITSFTPTNGNVGTGVTITGTNFTGVNALDFNGTSAAFTVVNATTITTSVPTGATTGPITVSKPGNLTSTSGADFVVGSVLGNTDPTLTAIANQRTCANQSLTINYTVGDAETPVNNLTVTSSGGAGMTVNADITGTGANRQATITSNSSSGASASVTLTVFDGNGGSAARTFNVVFDPVITANAGGNQTQDANQDVILNGSVSGTSNIAWTSSGSGMFADAAAAATTYTPSLADYLAGSVTLTLTASPSGGSQCSQAANGALITFTRPNRVVTGFEGVSGVYNNVTVQAGGFAMVDGPLDVAGAMMVEAGGVVSFAESCPQITGAGSFTLATDARLFICDPQGIAASGPSGQIRVTGTRTFSGGANYLYSGTTGPQQTGSGLPSVLTGDLIVQNSAGIDLSQNVGIKHILSADAGDVRQGDGSVIVMSDASGTGMVVNFDGVVTGAATVQRYIKPDLSSGLGYRHLSSPVTGNTFTDLATSGFVPVVNPAYNTASNPQTTVRPYPTIFGYNEARYPTLSDFQRGYFSPGALNEPMEQGRGYSVYMVGGITPDFVGTLGNGDVTRTMSKTGNFNLGTQKSGWHLFGNPYPAPIDWQMVTIPAGMSASVSVYRSTGGANGSYVTYTNGVGQGAQLIGIAQGFFVRALVNNVSFTLTNSCRVTEYADAAVYRAALEARPVVGLTLAAAGATTDETADAYVYFQDGATAGLDEAFDGFRPARNVGVPTLASLVAEEELAINALPPQALAGTRVPLLVDVPAAGRYAFAVRQLVNLPTEVMLYDALTRTQLPLTDQTHYSFTATAAGEQAGRFSLVFGKPAVAGAERLSVYPNPATATVRVAGVAGQAVELIDALGRVVRTQPATNGAETIVRLTGVPAGVYLLRAGGQTTRLVVE